MIALAITLIAGVAKADPWYWRAYAWHTGTYHERRTFVASLYVHVNTPMPHFQPVADHQRLSIPYWRHQYLYQTQSNIYYKHEYEGIMMIDYLPDDKQYKSVIERWDGQSWSEVSTDYFTPNAT
ncbi:MAG: hypothetical protein M3552_06780 [Planctomycetota bacterium]|nr:hypothetical protein [Planctomycetaceae bacterium]MDQ3330341.1 hypothetical protein [Planctomycetota bacterium]